MSKKENKKRVPGRDEFFQTGEETHGLWTGQAFKGECPTCGQPFCMEVLAKMTTEMEDAVGLIKDLSQALEIEQRKNINLKMRLEQRDAQIQGLLNEKNEKRILTLH